MIRLYMYTGDGLLDLNTGATVAKEQIDTELMPFLSYNRFAVLRPSLMLDYKQ